MQIKQYYAFFLKKYEFCIDNLFFCVYNIGAKRVGLLHRFKPY